jgi:hypothetical protein
MAYNKKTVNCLQKFPMGVIAQNPVTKKKRKPRHFMQNGSVGDSYIENVQAAKFKGHNRHKKA